MRPVQPMPDERLSGRTFALRNFVLVMRENQVLAAEVQIKTRSENFHAHGAALDVPAGPAFTPRTSPENVAILRRARLPKCEVGHRLLGVFVALDPSLLRFDAASTLAGTQFVKIELEQPAIMTAGGLVFFDAE